MSQKQHDALGAKVSAALPSELRADFNRLTDGWGDLMAVCEEAAFLVGLYRRPWGCAMSGRIRETAHNMAGVWFAKISSMGYSRDPRRQRSRRDV